MSEKIRDTIRARATIQASEKGYFVNESGKVVTPKKKVLKPVANKRGYQHFSYVLKTAESSVKTTITYHQLAAYQKFGIEAMLEGIVTRHKDDNPSNNRPDNILIGSAQDNEDDKSPEVKARGYIKMSRSKRVLTDQQVYDLREDRSNGMMYKDLAKKYNLVKTACLAIVHGNSYKDITVGLEPPPKLKILTDQEVYDLREDRSNGMSVRKLSVKYKISSHSCYRVLEGKTYKHIPLKEVTGYLKLQKFDKNK